MDVTLRIFNCVAKSLEWIGGKTGLTYNEVNILLYYLIIPLSWTIMLDFWWRRPYSTVSLILIWICIFIFTRNSFSAWCDKVFMLSVDFLNWFNSLGSNYVLNSVIICVVAPLAIYGFLIRLLS